MLQETHLGTLKGEKGDQGIQGIKGDKGDRGLPGQSAIEHPPFVTPPPPDLEELRGSKGMKELAAFL